MSNDLSVPGRVYNAMRYKVELRYGAICGIVAYA
jgi:hypothetical protein